MAALHNVRKAFLGVVLAAALLTGFAAHADNYQIVLITPLGGNDASDVNLRAALFKPDGDGPFPAIVAMHGCGGLFNKHNRLDARVMQWADLLTNRGYVVLFPDSHTARDIRSACDHNDISHIRTFDAYGALEYLRGQAFVISDRIGLLGWSQGGHATLDAIWDQSARRPGDLPATVDLPMDGFRAAVAFYPAFSHTDRHGWFTSVPLLAFLGASDQWSPPEHSTPIFDKAIAEGANIQYQVYPDTYHDFDYPNMPLHMFKINDEREVPVGTNENARLDVLKRVPDFFDQYLKDAVVPVPNYNDGPQNYQ